MSCLMHFITACLFSPSNVYLTAEVGAALDTPHRFKVGTVSHGEGEWCGKEGWCSGPVGVIRLGVASQLSDTLTLDYGLMHRSRVNTDSDRGSESVYASLTWRPFR